MHNDDEDVDDDDDDDGDDEELCACFAHGRRQHLAGFANRLARPAPRVPASLLARVNNPLVGGHAHRAIPLCPHAAVLAAVVAGGAVGAVGSVTCKWVPK